jgi:integrase
MERAQGRVIPWLFIGPTGERIRDFRTAWQNACVKAGISDKLVHDFRRSAVNSTNNAGVSIKTAMGLVGHKAMSVYNRYGIHDKKNLLSGAAKLADYFDKSEVTEQKVVQLKKTGTG